MKVIICEKSSMAREIVNALKSQGENVWWNKDIGVHQSNNYYITSLAGHIFELYNLDEYFDNVGAKSVWRLDRLPFKPQNNDFKYKLKKDVKPKDNEKEFKPYSEIYKTIEQLINHPSVDGIINSGDADEEGCILVKEVIDATKTNKPVYRIWCRDLMPETILEELNKLTPVEHYKKYELMGIARTYSDWLWGINGSRFLSIKAQNTLPVGRVKNCILGEIYNRDLERRSFVSTEYFGMESECMVNGINIKFISKYNTLKYDYTEETLQTLADDYNRIGAEVLTIVNDDKVVKPKKLFSLGSLQKYMSKNYKWSIDKVLDVCQSNYENHKIMSYPRTEEEVLSVNEQTKVKKIIKSLNQEFGSEKLIFKDSDRVFQKFEGEAHSALHPTGVIPDYNKLTADEKLIYETVKNRFCSNFAPDMIVSETKMIFAIIGQNEDGEPISEEFTKSAEVVRQPGWSEFEYRKPAENQLPNFNIGDKVAVNFVLKKKETTPKVKYNDASILSFMERPLKKISSDELDEVNSETDEEEYSDEDVANIRKNLVIGTPATRADIIADLKNKGFILVDDSGGFDISQKGIYLIESLQKLKIDYSAERTASLSYDMAKIDTGEKTVDSVVDSVYNEIARIINEYRDVDFEKLVIPPNVVGKCPICKNDVVEQKNSYACVCKDFVMLKAPKKLCQKIISPKLATTFLKQGRAVITDLKNKEGKIFKANAIMNTTFYKDKYWADFNINFDKPILCDCPICTGKIEINKATYSCSNEDFIMFKKVFFLGNNSLPRKKAKELIEKGRSRFTNLKTKEGKIYSAEIKMSPELNEEKGVYYPKYEYVYDNPEEIVGDCPICQGRVLEFANSYRCENTDFVMIKEDPLFLALGKKGISKSQAHTLLTERSLHLTGCVSKDGKEFNATLIMNIAKINDSYYPKYEFKRRTSNSSGGGNHFKSGAVKVGNRNVVRVGANSGIKVGMKKPDAIPKPRPKPSTVRGQKHELSK